MSNEYELSDVFVSALEKGEEHYKSPEGQFQMIVTSLPDDDPVKKAVSSAVYQADDNGLSFIKKQEGFYSRAYGDYKQYSIGYGTRAAHPGETISREDAETRLREETSKVSQYILRNVTTPLTQNQHNALVSFGYNVGTGGIGSLLNDINAGNHERVATRMQSWNRAGGQVLPGLVSRRQAESQMYMAEAPMSVQYNPSQEGEAPLARTSSERPQSLQQQVVDMTPEFMSMLGSASKAVTTPPKKSDSYQLKDYTAQ